MNKIKTEKHIPPAQLFVGPHAALVDHTKNLLKGLFCPHERCGNCITCKKIVAQQYHATLWLAPEKQYTRDVIEPIFKQIAFALEPNQKFFFVLQKAEFLSAACSNSLLKSVEEPPPGYHFIFLTERAQQILPTIKSRCVMHSLYSAATQSDLEFVQIFKKKLTCAPSVFLKMLSQINPSERETIEMLDDLLSFWMGQHKASLLNKKKQQLAQRMIAVLKYSLEHPPMPGSSKTFWKNFYLQVK